LVVDVPSVGDKTPSLGLTLSFAGDALFTSTFVNSSAANLLWNVVAADSVASTAGGLSRIITTSRAVPGTTNGGVTSMAAGLDSYLNGLTSNTPIANVGVNSANWIGDPSATAYAGSSVLGTDLNGGLQGDSTGVGFNSPVNFYYLARTVTSGLSTTLATNNLFQNGAGPATWTLAADGTATYQVSAVPLPATVWLMGSGLLAALGFARRRKAGALRSPAVDQKNSV